MGTEGLIVCELISIKHDVPTIMPLRRKTPILEMLSHHPVLEEEVPFLDKY